MQDALDRADIERTTQCKSLSSCSLLPTSFPYLPTSSFHMTDACVVNRDELSVLLSLVQPDGQVSGDHFGESDSRFSYILLNALSLLQRLPDLDELYDGQGRQLVLENILGCMNFDGAFGTDPGAESHGGQGESFHPALSGEEKLVEQGS